MRSGGPGFEESNPGSDGSSHAVIRNLVFCAVELLQPDRHGPQVDKLALKGREVLKLEVPRPNFIMQGVSPRRDGV